MRHTIGYDEPTHKALQALGVKVLGTYSWSKWPGFVFFKAKPNAPDAPLDVWKSEKVGVMFLCHDDDTQSMLDSQLDVRVALDDDPNAVFAVEKSDEAIAWMRKHHTKGIFENN